MHIKSLYININNQISFLVTNKRYKAITIQNRLQHEVTKEINKNIEELARGAANKFGETTKMDKKKK